MENLQTDYIDILYLHVWIHTTPIEEFMKALNSLVESTKVNYIAISDTPAWIVSKANTIAELRGWEPLIAYQFPYNLYRRDPERDVIPAARALGMGMTTWSVLGAGLFTGKYTRGEGIGRLSEGKWGAPNEESLAVARGVDEIADELEVSAVEVAIAWVLSRDPQIFPVVGASNKDHVETFTESTQLKLKKDYIDKINVLNKFDKGFARSFIESSNVGDLIFAETKNLIDFYASPHFSRNDDL